MLNTNLLLKTSDYNGMGYTIIEGKTYEYYYVTKNYIIDHSKPFIYKLIK